MGNLFFSRKEAQNTQNLLDEIFFEDFVTLCGYKMNEKSKFSLTRCPQMPMGNLKVFPSGTVLGISYD